MGDIAEYYEDLANLFDDNANDPEEEFIADEWVGNHFGHWRQKDGSLLKIKEMTNCHLENVQKFIEKNEADFQFSRVYNSIRRELCRRKRLTKPSVPERGSD